MKTIFEKLYRRNFPSMPSAVKRLNHLDKLINTNRRKFMNNSDDKSYEAFVLYLKEKNRLLWKHRKTLMTQSK